MRSIENITSEDMNLIIQLKNHDMTVEAVKVVRKITGAGLVVAKKFVDEL